MFDEIIEYFSIEKTEELNDGIFKFYVQKNKIKEVLNHLKNQPEFSFDILLSITAMDNSEVFEISYILYSTQTDNNIVIATVISREDPIIDSVCEIFSSANWDEREIYDLFGVTFVLHPNLKRLLMPKDWVGHPLRKDYELSDERLAWNK